ncbi:hypothetical protein FWK45_08765 [Histophilus somni]|uniref:Uncharacterized protein n=1 Tax=Histophilus somni TaxID=731 RepID=A0A9Q6K8D9_HISSO|nr:hypothetical protein [Histophilus somni]ARU65463.1 hypothetical protein BTV18_08120 [Histophilus somni]ARU67330.1 hypothetical protein BTV19_08550 [Histophilus somni]ARU69210.1 hypothetical protein BTV16_08565 [Histophilus somni]ARU71087.1 hypothetical protein BTV20_08570 [Histophilus somni]ARU72958.1 hypothetical protein BTV17_08545 [Histophilus somni]
MYRQIYAAYRGEINVADGTAEELAMKLGVKTKTVYKWATPSHHRRNKGQQIIIVKLDKEEVK